MSNNIIVKAKQFALHHALKQDTTCVHIADNKPKSDIFYFNGEAFSESDSLNVTNLIYSFHSVLVHIQCFSK